MADTSVTNSRALTYRDPTVTAAAAVQLRRNRQQSLDALAEQAQQTADSASRVSKVFQDRANSYRSAQDAADQATDGNRSIAEQQTDQASVSTSSQTGTQSENGVEEQSTGQTETPQTQPTVAFSAQQIAQEQLGAGLHTPPLQPADEAYRRAGAEPPLPSEESQPTFFALAV
ncbi:MAG TPA: hypothetical protein VN229_11705 [Terriglobales bacterium]|nr:hypothetical protein [Terriglobales bacterium]